VFWITQGKSNNKLLTTFLFLFFKMVSFYFFTKQKDLIGSGQPG
jgi:hypothetical protein